MEAGWFFNLCYHPPSAKARHNTFNIGLNKGTNHKAGLKQGNRAGNIVDFIINSEEQVLGRGPHTPTQFFWESCPPGLARPSFDQQNTSGASHMLF